MILGFQVIKFFETFHSSLNSSISSIVIYQYCERHPFAGYCIKRNYFVKQKYVLDKDLEAIIIPGIYKLDCHNSS